MENALISGLFLLILPSFWAKTPSFQLKIKQKRLF